MSPAALPPDLAAIADGLTRLDREVDALLAGRTPSQLDWQPRGGRGWSILQCLDHVVRANQAYLDPLAAAIAAGRAAGQGRREPLRLPWFGAWFVATLEPPPRRRLPAPGKIVPAQRLDAQAVAAAFVAAHDRVRGLLLEAAEIDLNRRRFRNPFLPLVRFTVGTGLAVIGAHGRRHLWQARQVVAAPGFPAG